MKIAELRRLPSSPNGESVIRTTEGQDAPVEDKRSHWKRRRIVYIAGIALALIIAALVWLLTQWSDLKTTVSADRLRVVTVTKGHFVRDVAAQGTVIAAVNPTLFAIAPGTISYIVHAGDTVTKGQPLATLESPDLRNEYDRERATLDSLN